MKLGDAFLLSVAAVMLTAAAALPVRAGDARDHDRARQALEAGEILPLRAILERVEREMGENVRISPVAIAHGSLTVQIKEEPTVSQPQPLARGQTVVVPGTTVEAQEKKASLALIGSGVSISEVVKGLNTIGVTPRDLITILQAI